jgi:hypothetical protein
MFYLSRLGARVGWYGEIAHLKVPRRDWPPRRQGTPKHYDPRGEAGHRHQGFQGCGGVKEAENKGAQQVGLSLVRGSKVLHKQALERTRWQ